MHRVEGLDSPDDLKRRQEELVQAFELRRDGLAGIAEDIPTALGDESRIEAIDPIAQNMRLFLASDVLFNRARDQIIVTLADEQIKSRDPEFDLPSRARHSMARRPPVHPGPEHLRRRRRRVQGIHGLALRPRLIDNSPLIGRHENSADVGEGAT